MLKEINTRIIYRGSSFSIDLPYSLFGGNTEGQCGELSDSLLSVGFIDDYMLI